MSVSPDVSKASGDGGQCIYVVTELRLVAVLTGSSYDSDRGYAQPEALMRSYALPAVH